MAVTVFIRKRASKEFLWTERPGIEVGVFRVWKDDVNHYPYQVQHRCGMGFPFYFKRQKDAVSFIEEITKTHRYQNDKQLMKMTKEKGVGKRLRQEANEAAKKVGAIL